MFPATRMRRLRSDRVRPLVRETSLTAEHLIAPLFVTGGKDVAWEIPSLPGQFRFSVDRLGSEADELLGLGVRAVLLFGVLEAGEKNETGSAAWDPDGPVARAIRHLKETRPELLVLTDVCLCDYTSHGHCGLIKDRRVDNDATLELLGLVALAHARAGADWVAPSDMMDGRVGHIRGVLDQAGYAEVGICAYSVKYASCFYGPFREAVDSAPRFGDRRGYQMDPANVREALREVELDLAEGADMVMVKPALAYLDVIRRVRDGFDAPVAAYQVSGEYAMIAAAARNGWLDEDRAILESLTAIRRAGADAILTYYAKRAASLLREGRTA